MAFSLWRASELWLAFGVHIHSTQAGPTACTALPPFPDHILGRAVLLGTGQSLDDLFFLLNDGIV